MPVYREDGFFWFRLPKAPSAVAASGTDERHEWRLGTIKDGKVSILLDEQNRVLVMNTNDLFEKHVGPRIVPPKEDEQ